MTEPTSRARALPSLRAMIDAVDRDILQLCARRMALVSEIAEFKREHEVPIRDLPRERQVLADRCQRATELALPPSVVEGVFRLLLVASRDLQASLRAEVPKELSPKTVAVIGGEGGMGQVLRRLFADLGHAVISVDLATELSAVEAARASDAVVVSVPIAVTDDVIRAVGPELTDGELLMDVTSTKVGPVRAMLDSTRASVVGTHPMFGPGVHTLTGQRVVVCPARGDAWAEWVRSCFRARGMVVTDATPEEHDRAMAMVQVLNHFQTQVLGLTLSRLGVDIDRTLRFTSPVYLLELYVCARHFAQSPDLYAQIAMTNEQTPEVTDAFEAATREVARVISAKDPAEFRALFDEVRATFGDFTEEALEQSRFLVDRVVELTSGRGTTVTD